MLRYALPALALFALGAVVGAQTAPLTGDRSTPLRPLGGEGNVGISNAVLRDQPEVRALRVVVEPGGTRALHGHADVRFHLFVPLSDAMTLDLEAGPVDVQPWHPYFLPGGTRHGFRNTGDDVVELMEIFIR
jgi:mannose-6-phosphate isomerase-like protein (cupin superfamily)